MPISGAAQANELFNGIPQQNNVLGESNAPVTMIEYVDIQCPWSARFETSAIPTIVRDYVRPGKLEFVQRLIGFIGPDSRSGRAAALAAGLQGKYFELVQILYMNQGEENSGWLTDDLIKSAAASIPGLDVTKLFADRDSSTVADEERTIDADEAADKVDATPTIFIGRTGSKPEPAKPDLQSVENAIAAALG
jgi:protein-disulfide isomerase